MDSNVIVLLVAIIGGLVSFLLELGIEKEFNITLVKKINAVIIGSVISAIGTMTFFLANDFTRLQQELDLIDKYLIETNPYSKAVKAIDHIDKPLAKKFFGNRLGSLEHSLNEITNKEILLARSEILNTWEELVGSAKSEILATNLVSLSDWKNVSRDNAGLRIQKLAIERGVKITRINIYDESNASHKEGLNHLKTLQSEIGINVHNISLQYIDKNETYDLMKQRLGTFDVVIVDGEVVLLTTVNPKTYKMQWSKLTFNQRTVAMASELFNKLLNDRELNKKQGVDNE
ncbi:MAG: hypothetical protein JAZ17_23975 [Candidatus Thiodiazotropha endolucinida]|nr:hypothetical protein [Candidatus Thiodiazotropha endolucinida]